jgi:hypothetical protein
MAACRRTARRSSARALLIIAALLPALAGCQGEDGHIRPWGMVVRQGSEVLVHARGGSLDGSLQVRAGEETPLLAVRFLDRHGTEIEPPHNYFLSIWAADPELLEWRTEEVGDFDGRIAGLAPGTTTLLIRWMHGTPGDDHKDRDWPVTLTVLP